MRIFENEKFQIYGIVTSYNGTADEEVAEPFQRSLEAMPQGWLAKPTGNCIHETRSDAAQNRYM